VSDSASTFGSFGYALILLSPSFPNSFQNVIDALRSAYSDEEQEHMQPITSDNHFLEMCGLRELINEMNHALGIDENGECEAKRK
jgi:hypothetical protein